MKALSAVSLLLLYAGPTSAQTTVNNPLPGSTQESDSFSITAAERPAQTMHLTNGALVTAFDHCGDMDLCARVAYKDNTTLSIYSEGAAECQPYLLHFVYADSSKTLFEFSRALNHTHAKDAGCGHTVATEMVLDRGYVHMLFTENSDGTINAKFSVAK